ncbi:LemA family protein [Qipengyuania aurantiaca]|uniref:LemA family protein n=1 Tax=Qipengyuania aurantiaca TaxID=2867233 RepID=A0ABX8ZPQ0_9SPHN|nr:LemA family protein [Qipengyuania aurantiaca]QZD90064.1 LemA family protein [Qipengyuania aurantiaca]
MNRIHAFRMFLLGAFALGLSACGINSVPTKEEAAKAQWGNVESAMQRRHDLIPNLVRVAEAAAVSERDILTGVIEARSKAMGVNITTDDLSDPDEFQKIQQAENQLTQAIGQFRTVVEQYPDLKSNENFRDLMVSLDESENLINTERMRYNEAAQVYNTAIRTFPETIGANIIHGAEPLEYFDAEDGAADAPNVEFDSITGDRAES